MQEIDVHSSILIYSSEMLYTNKLAMLGALSWETDDSLT